MLYLLYFYIIQNNYLLNAKLFFGAQDRFADFIKVIFSFNHIYSEKELLDLNVCDPAMGSGAFLVAACRFLSKYLVEAWNKDGLPEEFNESYDKDIYARRLVTQCCLYGVDKNPFAVNLASSLLQIFVFKILFFGTQLE